MVTPKNIKTVPLDLKQVTDVLFGIHSNEDYGSFMRNRDLRRKALDKELRPIPEGMDNYRTFDNLIELEND